MFQDKLCEAVLIGMRNQLRVDKRMRVGEVGTHAVMHDGQDYVDQYGIGSDGSKLESPPLTDEDRRWGTICEDAMRQPQVSKPCENGVMSVSERHERYTDDITGLPLPRELCEEGRRKELEYFRTKQVWKACKVTECIARTGKRPISVRWVETNKGG